MHHHFIHNAIASNIFGTIGTLCWTGQIIPQIWKSWRRKSTEGLSEWLMLLWGIAAAPYGVYTIVQRFNIPLLLQPQCFGFLAIISWGQCLYYGRRLALWKILLLSLGVYILSAGFQLGMIFAIRPPTRRGLHSPADVFGVLAMVLLAGGFVPQYVEIFQYGEVRGISLIFIFIDMCGGVFSLLSLIFQKPFNKPAGIAYSLVAVLDSGILIAALILNPRAERRRQQQRELESQQPAQLAVPPGIQGVVGDAVCVDDKGSGALGKKPSSKRRETLVPYGLSTPVLAGGQEDLAMTPLAITLPQHAEVASEMSTPGVLSANASRENVALGAKDH